MDSSLSQAMREIETILQSSQRPEVTLLQAYTTRPPDSQVAFVVALIGALLTARTRGGVTA
jgi:hypothetical protein